MKKTTTKRNTASIYEAVSNNVYYDGSSYRTRVTKNGKRFSKSFPSKKAAIQYRNQLLPA